MNSPFLRYLNQAARGAKSPSEKGKLLEEATKHFLTVDVDQQRLFDDVWLWKEYPKRNGRRDTGVDLVARKRRYGRNDKTELVAIQCKFYSSGSIGWKDISTFVASCSKVEFAAGILVATADLTADALLNLQDIPTIEVWYPERFDDSNIKWDNWDHQHRPKPHIEDLLVPPRHIQPQPRPYSSQPGYGRRTRPYSADRSPDKKPSILSINLIRSPLGILCMIASVVIVMFLIRVKEVIERTVVGVDVSAAVSMLLTRAEDALRIIVAIVIVLGIFAFYGISQRR